MIRSQILNNAYFSSANDGSLEQVLKSVGFEKGFGTMIRFFCFNKTSNELIVSLTNFSEEV